MDAVAPARSRPHEDLLEVFDEQHRHISAATSEMLETIGALDEQEGPR